jgi:hypothetical protein
MPRCRAATWARATPSSRSVGFFVEHLIKDLRIASEEAGAAGLEFEGLMTAIGQYRALAERAACEMVPRR